MNSLPSKQDITKALISAAKAHHEFQTNFLNGVHHEQWAMWYSAYALGRLGDFTTPTLLTQWLTEVAAEKDWFKRTAEHILERLKNLTGIRGMKK